MAKKAIRRLVAERFDDFLEIALKYVKPEHRIAACHVDVREEGERVEYYAVITTACEDFVIAYEEYIGGYSPYNPYLDPSEKNRLRKAAIETLRNYSDVLHSHGFKIISGRWEFALSF